MSHTPGPWSLETYLPEHDAGETFIVGIGNDEIQVCDEANALLIAAAPELLEALERAIPEIAVVGIPELLEQCRDAIKKARGE